MTVLRLSYDILCRTFGGLGFLPFPCGAIGAQPVGGMCTNIPCKCVPELKKHLSHDTPQILLTDARTLRTPNRVSVFLQRANLGECVVKGELQAYSCTYRSLPQPCSTHKGCQ